MKSVIVSDSEVDIIAIFWDKESDSEINWITRESAYLEIDISSKLVQENESSDKPRFGFWIKSLLTIVIVEEIFYLFEFLCLHLLKMMIIMPTF